ncbi:MAG TPA: efflux RND transporter periplasmic adaptor subunit [Thermoanaerobaculia bacterium]|jgi:membrane fusion protein (multidrug efflux system)
MRQSHTRESLSAAVLLSLALVSTVTAGCSKKKEAKGFAPPPVPVEVAEATRGNVRESLHALGTIEAAERVKVTAEIDAIARELPFDEGRLVRKGQVLAVLNDAELRADAGRVAAIRDQARLTSQRFEQLSREKIASSQDRDNARAALRVAEANVRLAQARLKKTRILAPFSGVVGSRLVSPGVYLKAGDAITELARIDTVKVAFAVPERYLADLRRGANVTVTTVVFPGKEFTGSVNVVDPILDPGTRSARLTAVIPNPSGDLRPGMSADVNAVLAERAQAVTVPDEAVFAEGDRNYVFVVQPDSTVARRAIKLGARQTGRVEVQEGLRGGDKVVRAGHQKLFDGAKVSAVQSSAATASAPSPPPAGGTKP